MYTTISCSYYRARQELSVPEVMGISITELRFMTRDKHR